MFRVWTLAFAAIAGCAFGPQLALAGPVKPALAPTPLEARPEAWVATSTSARATHCGPEADGLYEEAFDMLAMGERLEASARLRRVTALCPSHPFAAELLRLVEASGLLVPRSTWERQTLGERPARGERPTGLEPGFEGLDTEADEEALRRRLELSESSERAPEQPSLIARGEVVAAQTLHGLAEGLLVCAAVGCDDARVAVGLGLGGVAIGGGASFFLSEGIRPGQALAVNSGMGWGLWNAVAFANVIDAEDERAALLGIAGGLAGTAAGTAVAVFGRPRSGQVSLANSSGLWAGAIALWLMDFAEIELFKQTFFEVQLAATNIGLGVGALVARSFPMSRGRVLLIDAGGVAGTLLGVGTAVLIDSEPSARLTGGLAFVGTLAGLASVSILTRSLDEPDEPSPGLTLLPMGPRGSFGASIAVAF